MTLRLALVADETDAAEAFAELARALRDSADLRVDPFFVPTYAALLQALDFDPGLLVWAPPLVAHDLLRCRGAFPLAVAVRRGQMTYYSALVSIASGPRSLAELRGAHVGWVSRLSLAGYRIPRLHLRSLGREPDRLFGRQSFLGSHRAVAQALVSGTIDVAATHAQLIDDTQSFRPGGGLSGAHVIAVAGPIPSDVLLAGERVPPALRDRLRADFPRTSLPPEGPLARLLAVDRLGAVPPGHFESLGRWARRAEEGSLFPALRPALDSWTSGPTG
jgi:ABC-type phosphate/phosphonate transport system substrate-binding protein